MPGNGQGVKHPATRARRNRAATRATLTRDPSRKAPRIPANPDGAWHPLALQYWHDLWQSPMAQEFDPKTDLHGIYMLVRCYDDFLKAKNARERQAASVEVRLQGVRYGITPWDRRRLEWQIESSEEAKDRGQKRRAAGNQGGPAPKIAQSNESEDDDGHDVDGFLSVVS